MLEVLEGRLLLSRTWFVAPAGLDNNPGTLAQPFKTIQHAAALAQPGDTVYLRAGVYHETVTPAHSGTAAAPIIYSSYNNESVTIDGADALTGWTKLAGSQPIYYASRSTTLGAGNDQLLVNGVAMNDAEWPNTAVGAVRPATATISSVSSSALGTAYDAFQTATISVSGLPGGTDAWAGATIHFGAGQDWTVQTGTVLHSGPGTLTFTYEHQTSYESPVAGNKFYLTGKFLGLDAAGEWYRDPATNRVYFWAQTGQTPANVEMKSRLYALNLNNLSYLDIRNIKITAATIETNSGSSHLNISGITASYVSQKMINPTGWINGDPTTGIIINGSNNILQNSTILHSSGDGVFLGGSFNTVENCTIGYTDYSGNDSAGITLVGSSNVILSDTIYETGRDGILDSQATTAKIEYNTIYNIGLQTTDLGAIYDHGDDSHGTVIAYNNISSVNTGGFGGCGVYLDNGSADYVVHNNTISNVQIPIKLNPPSYSNSVYSNTINGKVVANQSSASGTPAQGIGTYHGSAGTLTTLGTLGGFQSNANAVNIAGTVVGASLTGHSQIGFLYANGVKSSIAALGSTGSAASAINTSGQITGQAYTGGAQVAYLDTNGSIKTLGALPGDTSSAASGINDSGQVAGVSYGADGVATAYIYTGGAMKSLGTLGGHVSQAYGINNAGTVVGDSTLSNDQDAHAFSWSSGTMTNLGTLGGRSSFAFAINNAGAIVGTSMIAGNGATHAFLSVGGFMHDLGTLSGYKNTVATGIDSAGSIVGYAYNSDISQSHAFIYRNGKMTDLNTLIPAGTGWILTSASGINDDLQIVGSATSSSQRSPGFLLTLLG